MGRLISGLLDNDSIFGQIMTRLGIIIGANLMFILFSFPIITIGPAIVALYHVMLKVHRGDGVLNPFKEFWIGFKNNFKQSFVYTLLLAVIVIIGIVDIRFCMSQQGLVRMFRYPIYVIGVAILVVTVYLFPVMAAFADTLPHLMRNAVFFAAKNPIKMLIILFFDVFPLYLTYTDLQMQPLYAFLWAVFGFAAIAMIGATLLIKDFSKFLPPVEVNEESVPEVHQKTRSQILREMKKLDR